MFQHLFRRTVQAGGSALPELEVIHRAANPKHARDGRPPLLFVHGMGHGAWCWDEHWLPAAADAGWDAWAVSVRGHGDSEGKRRHPVSTLGDYVSDVMRTIEKMPTMPVLIGHSMGGRIVQSVLQHRDAPAAVFMAPAPVDGGARQIALMLKNAPLDVLKAITFIPIQPRPEHLVSRHVPRERALAIASSSNPGTTLNIIQLLSPSRAQRTKTPSLLLAPGADFIIPMADFERTAQRFNSALRVYPGAGHDLMLDRDWATVLAETLAWIDGTVGTVLASETD